MLDNIEAGKWNWIGPNWAKISKDAQDLIVHMLDVSPSNRYQVHQCLEHKWFADASDQALGDSVTDALKQFQAKKRLKGAILGIVAAGKIKKLLKSPDQPISTTTTTTTTSSTAASAARPVKVKEAKPSVVKPKLHVKHMKGRDLSPKDRNGKSDPYLYIRYGDVKVKSSTQKKTLSPDWQDEELFLEFNPEVKELTVECWDWDLVGLDEYMGEFKINVSAFPSNKEVAAWYALGPPLKKSKKKSGKVTGDLHLCIEKVEE